MINYSTYKGHLYTKEGNRREKSVFIYYCENISIIDYSVIVWDMFCINNKLLKAYFTAKVLFVAYSMKLLRI